eukprot:CAMPEP_0113673872 /NCGR_PEP_ID=MMETSP0038_2-20120614/7093_1 /TAXON_ID=2898 /ORGANISM="Cryptomonas paramecium" /LENGTH=713 /DNA_ID=CAMNT_0000590367 /DNA_START=84 /DNA_END=2225 /DNA_ORIENTATION=- /assembly_acc=CAM_ASM_000170
MRSSDDAKSCKPAPLTIPASPSSQIQSSPQNLGVEKVGKSATPDTLGSLQHGNHSGGREATMNGDEVNGGDVEDVHDEVSDDDDEGAEGYKKGGYHPVKIGEVYNNNYVIIRKLGWGHFSTVWCSWDRRTKRQVALKVQKSAPHYTEAAMDEIEFLDKAAKTPGRGSEHVVGLLDSFKHTGPNGTHVCMVFEPMGSNLLSLIKHYDYRGVPIDLVKQIARQVLMGLDFLHTKCSIIHTDLKPENVLLCPGKGEYDESLEACANALAAAAASGSGDAHAQGRDKKRRTKGKGDGDGADGADADDGDIEADGAVPGSTKLDRSGCSNPAVRAVMKKFAPLFLKKERVLDCLTPENVGAKIVDLGNACYTHKHFTDDIQTRQYRSPEVIIGAKYDTSADMWSMACMVFELVTGDLLFDPHEGDGYDRDEDHLAQFQELLGRMPKSVAFNGKYSLELFNRKGELRNIRKLKFWDLHSVLADKYRMPPDSVASLASFLLPMLDFDPAKRATAGKMLQHPWADVHHQSHAKSSSTSPPRSSTQESMNVSPTPARQSIPVSPSVHTEAAPSPKPAAGVSQGSSPTRLAPLSMSSWAASSPHLMDRRATLAHTGIDSAHGVLQSGGSSKRLMPLSEALPARAAAVPSSSSSHSPIRLMGQVLGGMGLLGSSSKDSTGTSGGAGAGTGSGSASSGSRSRGTGNSPNRLAPLISRNPSAGGMS